MPTENLNTSKFIAIISITVWLSSLLFTGLSLYGDNNEILGAQILATGWLGLLLGSVAWYANPFYIYSFILVVKGDVPIKATLIALALSFDTLRFTEYLQNEAGGTSPVYGYGWGVLLWFISIFLLLVAVGTKQIEVAKSAGRYATPPNLRPVGILLIVVALASTGYLYKTDHSVANYAESKKLTNLIFKRGKVCSSEQPIVVYPIENFSGALEINIAKNSLTAQYPFFQIKDYLNWGVPKIRLKGEDYFYEDNGDGQILVSKPSSNSEQPQAILYVSEDAFQNISAKLIERTSNRVVFDYIWANQKLKNLSVYCPDYNTSAGKNNYPWKLLMDSLSLGPRVKQEQMPEKSSKFVEPVKLEILSENSEEIINYKRTKIHLRNTTIGYPETYSNNSGFNHSCGSNVGWYGKDYESRSNTGWPFRVNNKSYYFGNFNKYQASCYYDYVYLYDAYQTDNSHLFRLQIRNISTFRKVWSGMLKVNGLPPNTTAALLEINSITPTADGIIIEVYYEKTGEIFYLKAPRNSIQLE